MDSPEVSRLASDSGDDGRATPRTLVGGVQSVDRAVQVLEILARTGGAGVSEIAAEIDIHKSTAFRLLAALEGRSMVHQSAVRGKYQVGVGVLRLAGAVWEQLSIVHEARPVLERLADELEETANLAVRRSGWAINVDEVMARSSLATHDWIGSPTPLHATSAGKIFLAYLGPEDRNLILGDADLPRFTPTTVTARPHLFRELARTRERGWASVHGEVEEGLNALAVAVRDHRDEVIGAISVSGPAFRFDPGADPEVLETVLRAADEVSTRMGHRRDRPATSRAAAG